VPEPRRRLAERAVQVASGSPDPRAVLDRTPYRYAGRDTEPDPREIAAAVRAEARRRSEQREAAQFIADAPEHSAVPDICHGLSRALVFPDAGEGACCYGAIMNGPQACTCWQPVYDLEQQPLRPGDLGLRGSMCGDCAFRPGSPERSGDPSYQGDGEFLDEIVITGELFACHQGVRRVIRWVHPSGAEISGHGGDYRPPLVNGRPFKADGTPADLCAGWAARRLKYMQREAKAS